ncbi:hypothetical protein D3C84_1245480 [compost metagenome]
MYTFVTSVMFLSVTVVSMFLTFIGPEPISVILRFPVSLPLSISFSDLKPYGLSSVIA